jgi:hypothetical protein
MKTIRFIFALLLAATALPQIATAAAPGTSVHAILISATKTKGPADPGLAAYEAELQRNFPESSFHLVDQGDATVSGGPATIKFSGGNNLNIEATKSAQDIQLKMRWMRGSTLILDTTISRPPGVPGLLVHRPADDRELSIVLVIAR